MEFQQVVSDIKQGNFKSIYFLDGEEAYFIDAISNLLESKVLKEEEKSFNQTILYGKDTDLDQVVAEAKRYPMMAERVLVIVKEAQHIKNWEKLEAYAENPQPSTVLVFAYKYKKADRRKKVFKTISNRHLLFTSKALYESQIPAWINKSLQARGYKATPKAVQLLAESLGSDLGRISSELGKLEIIVPKGQEITDLVVEQNIGISKDYNNFELQNAVGARNFAKAIEIQQYFAADPKDNPLVLTISILYRFFSQLMMVHQAKASTDSEVAKVLRVNPYFAKDYLSASKKYSIKNCARCIEHLRDCDMKSKGVGNASTPDSELLKELLIKIFYRY